MHGVFENGFPWITIEVIGSSEQSVKVPVIIDTGFNGYLSLPYAIAFPIGLTLEGTGVGKIADGSFTPFLKCIGTIQYGETRVRTVIEVQPDCRPLLGNALLKELGRSLHIDPIKNTVTLEELR
jgi:clan AA aspartic protease